MQTDALQAAKAIARACHEDCDEAADDALVATLARHAGKDYRWRGMRPFYEQSGAEAACESFHLPLRRAFSALERREDIFFAGLNDVDGGKSTWTVSMGHFAGLFDQPWLNIPPTGRLCYLRYAEFDRIESGRVAETALFCDVIGVMQQAGHNPLPPQTGAAFSLSPGPRTQDGILLDAADPAKSANTMTLINSMIEHLRALNVSGEDRCPPEYLAQTWHEDINWYGPAGIGATRTIRRYQAQHQFPFREQLADKQYLGHVARIAEGDYCGFFGWSNLRNRPTGGFLGMTGSGADAEMRVVDVYRLDGDKVAENWVFIDLPHFLSMQGLDVLARMESLQSWR